MDPLEQVIGDEADALGALPRDVYIPRVPLVLDLAQVVQVLVEHLQPLVLTVDDVEILLRVDRQLMRQRPFANARALVGRTAGALAHLLDELTGLVVQDDAVVAVAVGDDDVAAVQNGNARRQVEMRGIGAFLSGRADLHQELVHLRRDLHDAMRIAFDDVDVAVPVHAARVFPVLVDGLAVVFEIAARHQQLAGSVEHHHGLGAAIEDIDLVVLVDGQSRNTGLVGRQATAARHGATPRASGGRLRVALSGRRRRVLQSEPHAGRQRRPVGNQFVAAVALRADTGRSRQRQRHHRRRTHQSTSHAVLHQIPEPIRGLTPQGTSFTAGPSCRAPACATTGCRSSQTGRRRSTPTWRCGTPAANSAASCGGCARCARQP